MNRRPRFYRMAFARKNWHLPVWLTEVTIEAESANVLKTRSDSGRDGHTATDSSSPGGLNDGGEALWPVEPKGRPDDAQQTRVAAQLDRAPQH